MHVKPAAHPSNVAVSETGASNVISNESGSSSIVSNESGEPPAKKRHIDTDDHNKTVKKVCMMYACLVTKIFSVCRALVDLLYLRPW